MLRNLARRGASVLLASALLGGGLVLGGGTASAAEAPGSVEGLAIGTDEILSAVLSAPFMIFIGVGAALGDSSDTDSVISGCQGQARMC